MQKQFVATATTPIQQSYTKLFSAELPAWKAMADMLRTYAEGTECQVMRIAPVDSPAQGEWIDAGVVDWDSAVSESGVYVAGSDEVDASVWDGYFGIKTCDNFSHDIMWYAVQIGDDYSLDCGAFSKDIAIRIAREEAMEHPEEEVRIASVAYRGGFCFAAQTVQECGESKSWSTDDLGGYGYMWTAKNSSGVLIDFESAMMHADVDTLEDAYNYLAEHPYLCEDDLPTAQELLDAYEEAHMQKYGEEWTLSSANPVW